jgi:transcription antitermination factor NusG
LRQSTSLEMSQLRVGDKIKIVFGPFSGLEGRVISIIEGGRAVIRLDVRDRQVLIELDCDMLTGKR